ncbi:uncharacterized protein N7473_011103 [Penicillium subrubescens]|nr:uncharacterized protein N7473_011103 [Penicillium subrubescens]KAJ5882841.1 hypothetical protein N7473_011103 [Penicillium subrubescens]
MPSKLVDDPRVSELDSASRAFLIISPRLRFAPLLLRVKDRSLDLDSLLEMQRAVLDYIRLLYSKGVSYQVRQEYMCPVKKASGRWKLYLGGWMEAGYNPNGCQLWPAEWKEQEASQCAEIERIFEEARTTIIGRHD